MDLARAWRVSLCERRQQSDPSDRDRQPHRRAYDGEQEILYEQEPAQSARARSERGTHHELVLTTHAPHQREVGDVRGGDDHHERGGAHQQPQREPRALAEGFLERDDSHAEIRPRVVRFLVVPPHAGVDGVDFPARLVDRGAGSEPRDHLRHAMHTRLDHLRAEVVRAEHHVEEPVHPVGKERRGLQNADDLHRVGVQAEMFADDVRVAAEVLHPEVVGEHHHRWHARPVVGRPSEPTEHGRQAHDLEEVSGHESEIEALGTLGLLQRAEPRRVLGDTAKGRHAVAKVTDLGHGERHARTGRTIGGLAQVHEALALAMRERLEQHPVHDAEDRGVGADA